MAKKDTENQADASAEATTDDASSDVTISTDAQPARDLSTGQGVKDVKPEDVPNALDAPNLPPEVRAQLVEQHPVTPGAMPAYVTPREQPMPVVTGTRAGAEVNDEPIVYYESSAHPELTVWHPNGERTIQFHNGRFGTANKEWQAVLDRTPEVTRASGDDAEVEQGGVVQIDEDGRVHSLTGADVEPVRVAEVSGNNA